MKHNKKVKTFVYFLLIFFLFLFPIYKLSLECKKTKQNCLSYSKNVLIDKIKKNEKLYVFLKALYWRVILDSDRVYKKEIKKNKDQYSQKNKNKIVKGILGNKSYFKSTQQIPENEISTWIKSHGGNFNLKFNNSSNINKRDINKLKLVWKHQSISSNELQKKWNFPVQANPIFFDNKLISFFPDGSLRALNPDDGRVIWKFNNIKKNNPSRGIVGHENKNKEKFIFFSLGKYIYKIYSSNGEAVKNFGKNGKLKIHTIIPPHVYKNQLLVVSSKSINVFNIKTGKFNYKINFFDKKSFKFEGRVWGGSAIDVSKGIVYVVTGNPKPATYGAYRIEKDTASNSIIAIDLQNKKILWKFQEVYHDLWDYDISSPPILHDLKLNNHVYEVIIVNTKIGNTIILERNSGKNLYDLRYKKSPKSTIPGENASPQQIFFDLPEKFSKIDFSLEDINKLENNKKIEIEKNLLNSKYGWFETPSLTNDLIIFGLHGGAQWHGSAFDPFKQYLYVPSNNVPWKIRPFGQDISLLEKITPNEFNKGKILYRNNCSSCHGLKRNGKRKKIGERSILNIPSLVGLTLEDEITGIKFLNENVLKNKHKDLIISEKDINQIYKYFKWKDRYLFEDNKIIINADYSSWSQFITDDGLPASNPPWGYIAKINLNDGKVIYKSPIGREKINGENKIIGTRIFGGIAINNELIFANGTADKFAYILDAETGKILWDYEMEAAGSAPPIIFNYNGREYVSFLATGGRYYEYKDKGSTIYTFSIK